MFHSREAGKWDPTVYPAEKGNVFNKCINKQRNAVSNYFKLSGLNNIDLLFYSYEDQNSERGLTGPKKKKKDQEVKLGLVRGFSRSQIPEARHC